MSFKPKIYVDLDGVIKSFVMPAMAKHGASIISEVYYPYGFQWDVVGAVNYIRRCRGKRPITPSAFWDSFDYDFWLNLDMYPEASAFLDELDTIGEVYFATSPTLSSECVAGKYDWVKKHFRSRLRNLHIGASKQCFAKPGAVLIDDRNENVDKFLDAGGDAFLVPRAWNRCCHSADPYTNIIIALRRLFK